jgi:hypothetical protein
MSNYSRQHKKTNKDSQETGKAGGHLKKGLSAFQKTLTLIGSMLGIITATITIMNAMKSNEQKKSDTSPSIQTTIIKEVQKETSTDNEPSQNQETNPASNPVENKNDNKGQGEASSNSDANSKSTDSDVSTQADTATTENKTNP